MLIKKVFIITMICGSIAIFGLGHAVIGQELSKRTIDTIAELDQACRKNKDEDGFGNVELSGSSFYDQKGSITVPCKVHLKPGSTLQMTNVELQTKNFLIDDGAKYDIPEKNRLPDHIIFKHVTMSGIDSGFQIQLNSAKSTVLVEDSSFNYPLSVGISVGGGDADEKASLVASRNTMTSKSDNSEGILLVSTGQAVFSENRFVLLDPEETALLLGKNCQFTNNINANDRCQGDE